MASSAGHFAPAARSHGQAGDAVARPAKQARYWRDACPFASGMTRNGPASFPQVGCATRTVQCPGSLSPVWPSPDALLPRPAWLAAVVGLPLPPVRLPRRSAWPACSRSGAVVVEAARAGPSTGMPTKTEQSNLDHFDLFGARRDSARRARPGDRRGRVLSDGARLSTSPSATSARSSC